MIFSTLIMASFFVCPVSAKLYKWVDENGVAHYSNTAPPQSAEVETQAEAKGDASPGSHSLDNVLDSYRKDQIGHDERPAKRSQPSGKSDSMADYYANRIKQEKATVEDREADLDAVKRESYSNAQDHKEKVRYYKSRLEKARLELERVKAEYQKAKYGN